MILTEKEVAEKYKVSKVFLNQCRKKGMPFKRFGSKMIRYETDEIEKWINRRNENTENQAYD